MNKFLFFLITLFCISCNQVQYGEKNELGFTYYFNSISGDNSNIGIRDKPLRSLDFLDNINLKEGDKILLANGSTFYNTINLINKNGIEISNYLFDDYSEIPTINSKAKIAAVFIENSSNININNIEIIANGGGANEFLHKKLKTDLRTAILYLVTNQEVYNNLDISNVFMV